MLMRALRMRNGDRSEEVVEESSPAGDPRAKNKKGGLRSSKNQNRTAAVAARARFHN